ncbi:MAG: hypothetical protein GC172_02225 [Phycisphaera sp.]|nr:hypothetical protein [Phycisphaera sp.]
MPRTKKKAVSARGTIKGYATKGYATKGNATKGSTRGKTRAKSAASRAPKAAALSTLPTEVLAAELARRRSELPRLRQQADALRGQLAALESRIALLSGHATESGTGPARTAPAAARSTASPKTHTKAAARGGSEPKRGPRVRRDGRPTLGVLIGQILGESRDALALRDIAERAASALGRAVNPSFLVQTSQTLRKLVVRGAAAQPSRGMYARGAAAAEQTKEGSHAVDSATHDS